MRCTYLCAVLEIDGWIVHFNDGVEPVNSSPVSVSNSPCARTTSVAGRRGAWPVHPREAEDTSRRRGGMLGLGNAARARNRHTECRTRHKEDSAGVGFSLSRGEVIIWVRTGRELEGGHAARGRGIPRVAGQAQRI